MVISQTPFRMSFFGGGTDFESFYKEHGGAVISTTFNKYCYVNVRELPGFFDFATEVSYSQIERVNDIDEIKHPAIREAMRNLDIRNIRLTYEADLPARTGLGTSSSFAVGMIHAFHALRGEYTTKRKLADEAIFLERVCCGETGGLQDQIAVAYGGLNRIDFNSEGYSVRPIIIPQEKKKKLNENLMLFFTGFSRFSFEIQKKFQDAMKEKEQSLMEMLKIVDEAEKVLSSEGNLNEFGRLLDYSWKLKRGLTNRISTDAIDMIYNKAVANGALGGKLLGAGGGGFLLFYVEREHQSAVKKILKDFLLVPFSFENEGTKILFLNSDS